MVQRNPWNIETVQIITDSGLSDFVLDQARAGVNESDIWFAVIDRINGCDMADRATFTIAMADLESVVFFLKGGAK